MQIPLPKPNADTQPYWDAAAEGRLLYQQCTACNRPQFYPRGFCVACHSDKVEWRESTGLGTIVTFSQVFRAPSAAFRDMSPYIIALIDLDEGFRMMVNIVESENGQVSIGAKTETVFQEVGGFTLPQGKLR